MHKSKGIGRRLPAVILARKRFSHQKVEDGVELSELCSDWKDIVGVLGNPKQEVAAALLRVRYCLLGILDVLAFFLGSTDSEPSAFDRLQSGG